MADDSEDTGPTTSQLWRRAWGLGVLGLVAWIQVASRLDGVRSLDRTWGTWLACASLATVFSACCAILAGVKAAEARLRALARETQD